MDKNRIVSHLLGAIQKGAVHPPYPHTYPSDSSSAILDREHGARASETEMTALERILREEPSLKCFDGGYSRLGPMNRNRLELRQLARWLFSQSLGPDGPHGAVDRLSEVVSRNEEKAFLIRAINGLQPTEKVELTRDVVLLPFSDLPPSFPKDVFLGIPGAFSSGYPHARATAALVVPYTVSPVLVDNESVTWDVDSLREKFRRREETLEDVRRALTLIGPSAPCSMGFWHQYADWRCPIYQGVGMGQDAAGMYHAAKPLAPFSSEDAKDVVNKYLSLTKSVSDALTVPIDRLNECIRRQNNVDRAIDLGIALEALILSDGDRDQNLHYRLALRGAWFFGKSLEEREEALFELRQIYDLRSIAVHSGHLPSKWPKRSSQRPTDEWLAKGATLCANLIRKIVDSGCLPDWDGLVLGSSGHD